MNPVRFFARSVGGRSLAMGVVRRSIASSTSRRNNDNERIHSNVEGHRQAQKEKPLNPHLTNTNSTIHNNMPSVGKDKPPPDLLSSVDPNYTPKDKLPENTERMTGGTQEANPDKVSQSEYGVGEMEGISFRVEPLRRTGEDVPTMRARLLYQSRKRGTLESDLLLSTFAATNLSTMSRPQLEQYDLFLDENDWDIYYWATQSASEPPTSVETAEGSVKDKSKSNNDKASPTTQGMSHETDAWRQGAPRSGEWAQTVGTFKPAYRPVPQRWKDSEILALLRRHVRERSAGGVLDDVDAIPKGKGSGLGRMPDVQVFE